MAETTPVSVGYSQVTRKREGYVRVWKNHWGVVLNVFEFRQTLVNEYAEFTRSFTRIKADDIRTFVDAQYASQKYWPEPLIQVNPNFQPGGTVEALCDAGQLSPACADIFRFGKSASSAGQTLPLYRHQVEAISLASAGESYVLTTGTGSGKSLSYFIPIIDHCLKARQVDKSPRTRAIVVYPMNALANSQLEELKKFLGADPGTRPVTFGRFTGQESTEEREAMKANPPDILLTNFMMLELLLTRQNAIDQQVIANATGLKFLVLDELHTYRRRQGADVALLVRRVREALADQLVCIGTSATMATDGTEVERNAKVAEVASRLFGTKIPVTNIITETLKRTTPRQTEDLGPCGWFAGAGLGPGEGAMQRLFAALPFACVQRSRFFGKVVVRFQIAPVHLGWRQGFLNTRGPQSTNGDFGRPAIRLRRPQPQPLQRPLLPRLRSGVHPGMGPGGSGWAHVLGSQYRRA